jgi:hypothetical protein
MNPDWTEGQLEFDFSGATSPVGRYDNLTVLKTVDFVVCFAKETWLIECKDPEGAGTHSVSAVKKTLQELRNDELLKTHLLPKLYGTYAHLAMTNNLPKGRVRYGVVIGLSGLDAALCIALTDRIQRIVNQIGPKRPHSRFVPEVEVHNVERWNRRSPHMAIQRHP